MRLGELPDEWKIARVSPIPEGETAQTLGIINLYQLLSILSKLIENHIQNLLVKHFEEKHPISAQHAIRVSLMLCCLPLELLELGHDICAVFSDYMQ